MCAVTSGDHDAMLRQMVAQQRIHAVIVDALRGTGPTPAMRREPALRVATLEPQRSTGILGMASTVHNQRG